MVGGTWSGAFTVLSTNSVYANITNSSSIAWSGNVNGFYYSLPTSAAAHSVLASPFQSVGAGNYYLTDASGFRNAGTTSSLPASLLRDLAKRTTLPSVARRPDHPHQQPDLLAAGPAGYGLLDPGLPL